jgi:hypothetical protein
MKVEVEISSALAHRLSYNMAQDDHSSPERIPERLQELVQRYGEFPKLLEPKHESALAILRDQAVERAIQCAKPGDDGYRINRLAEELLSAVLVGR